MPQLTASHSWRAEDEAPHRGDNRTWRRHVAQYELRKVAVTNQLKTFEEASKLPEQEQDGLARLVLIELTSERRRSEAFAGSGKRLRELADEAATTSRRVL